MSTNNENPINKLIVVGLERLQSHSGKFFQLPPDIIGGAFKELIEIHDEAVSKKPEIVVSKSATVYSIPNMPDSVAKLEKEGYLFVDKYQTYDRLPLYLSVDEENKRFERSTINHGKKATLPSFHIGYFQVKSSNTLRCITVECENVLSAVQTAAEKLRVHPDPLQRVELDLSLIKYIVTV